MPREPVVHMNIPDDDVHTACGRKLIKVKKWDIQPIRVTCLRCKAVMNT